METRREVLARIGAAVLLTSGSRRAIAKPEECVLRPRQTEGPYYVGGQEERVDLRSDSSDRSVKDGVPLRLILRALRSDGFDCVPLVGALVDVWHCDAAGVYSGVLDEGFDTRGKKFLRGFQRTDKSGRVEFTTIYPGWYPGRTVHVHFKMRSAVGDLYDLELTSQLYFDDAISKAVLARPPYQRKKQRDTFNADDGIYEHGGSAMMLDLKQDGRGYVGALDVGLLIG